MDIRQLHYFLVLCEEMNYTRAAQRLFLSRQALRQSISALEAELCGPLFLSAHHKLSLTERGVSLQRHAAPVVEQFQQMQSALRAEIQSAQPVRIGISVALVPDYLPGLETQLDKFRQQYPHIEMRFRLLDNDAVAEGVDIDPVAVRTAGENAALNGVADKLTVLVGDLSDKASGKYDIITANIVANAIMALAPAVPGLMADDAVFIASGIIDSRKDEVIAALEAAGLIVQEVKEKRGWECIVCKKA